MSRFWFIVIMILVLQSFLLAETPAPKDPNLGKPVTLAVKGEALVDILPMLEKQTGAKLHVVKAIAEQKATIFVDAKSLRDVMHGLETLFGYKWSMKPLKDYRVYELWEPEKIRMERVDISQALASAIWKQLDSELAKKLQFYPKDENEIHEAIIDAAEKYKLGLFNEDNKMRLAGQAAWAKICLGIQPGIRAVLISGASAWYDTDTNEAEWRIPADLARVLASVEGGVSSDDNGVHLPPDDDIVHLNVGIESHASEYDGSMSASLHSSFQSMRAIRRPDGTLLPSSSSTGGSDSPSVKLPITGYLPPDRLPHKQDDALYARTVEFTPEELAKEADVPGQDASTQPMMVNRSDILSLLHRKLGLQIMADHYSKWIPLGSIKTLADCISSIEAIPDAPKAYWGWDGNFIYAHTKNVRQWSRREIPNTLLRQWQQAYTDQGWMNIDQLAEMALLSKEQLLTLDADGRYMGIGNEKDRIGYQVLMLTNELRMYGALSPAQRKESFNGGTKTTGFTSQQLGALVQCVNGKQGPNGILGRPIRSRVGLWKDGIRIDKPLTLAPEDPVLLVIREGITSSGFGMSAVNPNGSVSLSAIEVVPEGGNRPMQAQTPGYTMTFRFADGFSIDSAIPVGPQQGPMGFGQ